MGQLNMQVTPRFEAMLARFMKARGIKTKSEAIRLAVEEALAAATRRRKATDFREWLEVARRSPDNPSPRFKSDDDLWAHAEGRRGR